MPILPLSPFTSHHAAEINLLPCGETELQKWTPNCSSPPLFGLVLISLLIFLCEPRDYANHSVWAILTVVFEFSIDERPWLPRQRGVVGREALLGHARASTRGVHSARRRGAARGWPLSCCVTTSAASHGNQIQQGRQP